MRVCHGDLWAGARDALRRAWNGVWVDERKSGPMTVGPQSVVLVAPRRPLMVSPPPRPVWDDRGWTARVHGQGRIYEGQYRVLVNTTGKQEPRRFTGRIFEPPSSEVMVAYIADPPAELRRHPKGACFQLVQTPWFRLHWVRPAATVDDAILYIEGILAEALQEPRKSA